MLGKTEFVTKTLKLTPGELRQTYDQMEKMEPDLWHVCYPRTYNEPKVSQFYSPKEPGRQFFGAALKSRLGIEGSSDKYEFLAASHIVRYRVPTYWLSSDMALAIQQTIPPQEFNWYEMPFPFEGGVIMLPKGSLVHPTEGDVAFVTWSRFKSKAAYESLLIPGTPYGSFHGGMTFLLLTMGGQHLMHWNLPLDAYGPTISLGDIEAEVLNSNPSEVHDTGFTFLGKQPEMTTEDHLTLARAINLVFSTLLLIQARPELVTMGARLKTVTKKGKSPREFWTPTIIGEHYKIRREGAARGMGEHNSPRLHWVRGHYAQQAYGPGWQQRRQIWKEPFLRGVEE
jgi:hypothetical protein